MGKVASHSGKTAYKGLFHFCTFRIAIDWYDYRRLTRIATIWDQLAPHIVRFRAVGVCNVSLPPLRCNAVKRSVVQPSLPP